MTTMIEWKDAMEFDGIAGEHTIKMDAKAPIGKDRAATPKELVALGLGGCTAMDVIALLKKHNQPPNTFRVEVEIQPSTQGNPVVFDRALLRFVVHGAISPERLIDAVQLSQTKYCGVSAMLSKAFPIEYRVILNGTEIGTGMAKFNPT